MRVRRKFVSWIAPLAVCLTAGAQISPAPNSAPNPESQSGSPHSPQTISPPAIQTARAVHSLLLEQAAQQRPVLLRAVVTYYDPYIDSRHGALFVHDASGGVFVMLPSRPILPIKPGSLVAGKVNSPRSDRRIRGNGSSPLFVSRLVI